MGELERLMCYLGFVLWFIAGWYVSKGYYYRKSVKKKIKDLENEK